MGQHAADDTPEDAGRRPVVEGTTAVVGGHALAEEVLVLDCKQEVAREEGGMRSVPKSKVLVLVGQNKRLSSSTYACYGRSCRRC